MLRHACGYALANKGMTPEPCRLTTAIRISSVSNRTTSESYVGVTRSLAAPLRFPHGPPCHGAWKIKPMFSDLNGGYRSIAHDRPT